MSAFSRAVLRLTGWSPDTKHVHWKRIPHHGYGIALRFRLLRDVHFPLPFRRRFPQLGWLRLPEGDMVTDDGPYEEGQRVPRVHLRAERNSTLRRASLMHWTRRLGRIRCLACSFDFERRYGTHGRGFIEMHHRSLFANTRAPRLVKAEDLVPLCSNCHRMVHKVRDRFLSIDALKRLLAERPRGSSATNAPQPRL
jgi:hypothetical protein